MLRHIAEYIGSPSAKEKVIDAVSFVLPKAVCKISGALQKFSAIADSIIEQLVLICNPRDMLTILCEAIDSASEKINITLYLNPLLVGISRVFISLKRRQYKQVKAAVPVVVRALKQACLSLDDEDELLEDLFSRAIGIAESIRNIQEKLVEGELSEKLRTLLSLYILQVVTYLSVSLGDKTPKCLSLVSRLSCFLHYCHLSYVGLLSGSDIVDLSSFLNEEEDGDNTKSCFLDIECGAALSVIWGYISNDVVQSAKENLDAVENELKYDQIKKWQVIGMLKHIFSSADLPWVLKKHAIDFVCCITEGNISGGSDGEHLYILPYIPSIFAAMQGIQTVIVYCPDAQLRKMAYNAMKKVLADIPTPERSDMLKALIIHSNLPSMKAILLDCVREEIRTEANQQPRKGPIWTIVLELVELVLRPSKGGPPHIPEESDAVSSALNLYRFVLMVESAGNTNYSGVLSETNLRKASTEWLLPLRSLVTGILAENKNDHNHLTGSMVCALNPVELVLYRCIELVEEKLKDCC
ncbi:hypothetical protein SAY86_022296 [Trapa natans]|uniref:Aberrant root formation protein 4 n=1 Tax=Trapa natans TaxID=22666 RepID=A0AAN7LSR9_TRANT|nr:hypothetical protein SAY86_022296 [Trapa natans]